MILSCTLSYKYQPWWSSDHQSRQTEIAFSWWQLDHNWFMRGIPESVLQVNFLTPFESNECTRLCCIASTTHYCSIIRATVRVRQNGSDLALSLQLVICFIWRKLLRFCFVLHFTMLHPRAFMCHLRQVSHSLAFGVDPIITHLQCAHCTCNQFHFLHAACPSVCVARTVEIQWLICFNGHRYYYYCVFKKGKTCEVAT